MEQKTGQSTATTAYGRKLDTPITYDYAWSAYVNGDELVAAKDELTLDEQVVTRNTQRQNNARQKALQVALDAAGIVKPTEENDPQLRLRNMVKTIMSNKSHSEESARALASQILGIEWQD